MWQKFSGVMQHEIEFGGHYENTTSGESHPSFPTKNKGDQIYISDMQILVVKT